MRNDCEPHCIGGIFVHTTDMLADRISQCNRKLSLVTGTADTGLLLSIVVQYLSCPLQLNCRCEEHYALGELQPRKSPSD